MKILIQNYKIIIRESFYFLSVLICALFILEIAFSGMISAYINFNFLILFCLLLAIGDIIFNKHV